MPSQGAPDVSLVIPAFNEAHRLEASFRALREYLGGAEWSHEVVLVIERSTDGTLDLARRLAAGQAAFRVLGNEDQRGKGHAVRCGMLAATGAVRFFMDADLSTPLAEIGRFLEVFGARPATDILIGNRQHAMSRILQRQSWLRERMGQTFNKVLRKITRLPFPDTQCGFKAFRRHVVEPLFGVQRVDGFAFDVEILLLAQKRGYVIEDLPVEWRNAEGSKVHMVRDSWRMLRDAWKLRALR
jgi:glycosyltransferase involved in cell wall biosynthesis